MRPGSWFLTIGAASLTAVAVMVLIAAPPAAAKGGGGSGGGGSSVEPGTTVYYTFSTGSTSGYAAMNADGTGKTTLSLPAVPGEAFIPPPSRATHGGQRWFLQWRETAGTYADGKTPRVELFAINASGAAVPLTNDPDVVPDHNGRTTVNAVPVWSGTTDDRISYGGYTLGADLKPATWGIYTANVVWDANGAPVAGTAPSTLVPGVVISNVWQNSPPYGWFVGVRFAWSPDGTQMVYTSIAGDLQANAATYPMYRWSGGVSTPILDGATQRTGWTEGWSAAGRIVYRGTDGATNGAIMAMNPDGSSTTTVVAAARWPLSVRDPRWSPSGAYLVYCYDAGSASKPYSDVHRVAANGSGDTILTSDLSGYAGPIDWR
jgi:hypothetical protein